MPHGDLHQKKKQKNYIVLGAIVGWIALIWIITMIKLTQGG
jgi:hypothetical protein